MPIPPAAGQDTSASLANRRCLECHGRQDLAELSPDERRVMVVPTPGEPDTETWRPGLYLGSMPLRYSVHADLRCVDCHPGADRLPHPRKLAPVTCNGVCHTQARVDYDRSAHAEALAEGAPDAPTCARCHGTHGILPAEQREAPTHPLNAIGICGDCHKTHTVPLENGMDGRQHVQSYLDSVHGKGISAGGLVFATGITPYCTPAIPWLRRTGSTSPTPAGGATWGSWRRTRRASTVPCWPRATIARRSAPTATRPTGSPMRGRRTAWSTSWPSAADATTTPP
ncbi:MAG: hypothetical protein ACYSW1_20450 [Planctomycetota bacterium]